MCQTAFRPSCMNRASVFEWYKRFKKGRGVNVGGVRKSINQSWLAKGLGLGLGLLCWGFKGVQEEIPSKEASTLQIYKTYTHKYIFTCTLKYIYIYSVGRGKHSSNRVSGISSRTMHQSTAPSLSQTIWPRWASRQFLSLPIIQTLLPVTFGYSLSSEAVVMIQLRRWKRLWRMSLTRSYKRTSMGPWRSCWNGTTSALQPEEITSKGIRVSCV